MLRRLFTIITVVVCGIVLVGLAGGLGLLTVFWHFGRGLPDYHHLADYQPPITTRVYAGDGRLVAEYAAERRSFVPLAAIPRRVIDAFLAAEDKNFYSHHGIDPVGMARAAVTNLQYRGERRPMGASTITQQVAKNFLLTNEVSLQRKIKEALLAFRLERAFTKNHILELYLNEIYLGEGSYGVAAAAMNYFNKSLDELTVAECAFLGALPKAPNNYNPIHHNDAATERRDWVIGRMLEDGKITQPEARAAIAEPLAVRARDQTEVARDGDYFAEDIRRELAARFGEDALYKGGLSVRSTMDPRLQVIATRALRDGLIAYDRRHGWRGPLARIAIGQDWANRLAQVKVPPALAPWTLAVVLSVGESAAEIGLADGRRGHLPFSELKWAAPWQKGETVGPPPHRPADVVARGDVVAVEPVEHDADGKTPYPPRTYGLRQLPRVEGALVAMNPRTGRVLAMAGGYSFERSQFNRATQALRQPGSSFKPFIYLAALDHGYTPSSLVLDAPLVLDMGPGQPKWRPSNYHHDYLGPTTLRVGLEKSRNLMTVRLAQALGMEVVADYAEKFGVVDHLPRQLAMSLGAAVTTPLRMTAGYAQLVNGGRRIRATLIDRIQDRTGKTIYRGDTRPCEGCGDTAYSGQDMPEIPDTRAELTDPASAYQLVHMLEGVVERGTGHAIASLGRPLAGKTGTSNQSFDTWFVGFAPDLAVGVFVGFDEPATLGAKETGASTAVPIFREFMGEALKGSPITPFPIPPGVRLVRVSARTGRPAQPGDRDVILEAFKADHPVTDSTVLDNTIPAEQIPGEQALPGESAVPEAGTLY